MIVQSGFRACFNVLMVIMGFNCSQCDNQFVRKKNLNQHIKSGHEDIKYTCSQCGRKFSQKCHLDRHILLVHKGCVKIQCSQCESKLQIYTKA